MNTDTPSDVTRPAFDVEKYAAEHKQPSEVESAVLTIVLFVAMIVFAVGCVMLGWFD